MNWNYIRKEWGGVTFVATVVLGGLAVLVALVVKAASPTPIPVTPPCPQHTPFVIQASPAAGTSPTPAAALPSVPFGCPTIQVVVATPTPSPTPTPTAKASASPSEKASPSSSPTATPKS